MTDRELLEKAAKAAGYSCWKSKHGYLNVTRPDGSKFTTCHYWPSFDESTGEKLPEPTMADAVGADNWAPLVDDGEALRLAVKLGIHITNSATDAWASTLRETAIEPFGDDPYAATRRAIVRAAAAMREGK